VSLSRRVAAVAEAGEGRETLRLLVSAGAIVAFAAGAYADAWPVALGGAFALGWALGTITSNVDRSYMEGFSDGLVTAATEPESAGPRADVRGVPGGPVAHERAGADGTGDEAGPDDRGPEPESVRVRAFAGPLDGPGLPRPALTPEGEPTPGRTFVGAAGAAVPIPAATTGRHKDEQPRPKAGRPTRRVVVKD
jgi:hypothetical protein